jgi:hypothetical protein
MHVIEGTTVSDGLGAGSVKCDQDRFRDLGSRDIELCIGEMLCMGTQTCLVVQERDFAHAGLCFGR